MYCYQLRSIFKHALNSGSFNPLAWISYAHWQKIRTNNVIERLNREIRR